jgi:predicted transcriptional regulator
MNVDLHKLTKNFMLNEGHNPNVLEYLNILEGNLRLIRATNRGDQSRLDAAKNIIREVKSRVKKLEEKVSVLEEQLKVLEEGNIPDE